MRLASAPKPFSQHRNAARAGQRGNQHKDHQRKAIERHADGAPRRFPELETGSGRQAAEQNRPVPRVGQHGFNRISHGVRDTVLIGTGHAR